VRNLGLVQQPLVMSELALRLLQGHLVWPWIDLRQKVAFADHLTFLEGDLGQLTVDLSLQGDGGERRHRAKFIQNDADIAFVDAGRADQLRHGLRTPSGPGAPGSWCHGVGPPIPRDHGHLDQ
jgi:hypothetical protein